MSLMSVELVLLCHTTATLVFLLIFYDDDDDDDDDMGNPCLSK